MIEANYNPDVLTCLANLSNDEVFTPPTLVNEILDLLPQDIWENKDVTFLDPVCKSGVFLREIAKRLLIGLEKQIPDKQKRINHIFTKQLFGIAITELTSLLSRRSVYCSKNANGKYSICNDFKNEEGNIAYTRLQHTWENKKCKFCGASQEVYDRDETLETYAYPFIHTDVTKNIFKNMKFDVIIGNPPYQMSDGGGMGASAIPLYHLFIQQAKKMNPKYLSMIVPSRWFTGGRGLESFRDEMLNDNRIRQIHDYLNASDCFPGVEIKGGVSYFLWDRDNRGDCLINTYENNNLVSKDIRPLLEKDTNIFIRYNQAINILNKVRNLNEKGFSDLVSPNDPFGFDIREENSYKRVKPKFNLKSFDGSVSFYYNGWKTKGLGYIDKKLINKNVDWVGKIKILVPKAIGSGDSKTDIIKPFIPDKFSACTETYLIIGPLNSLKEANNIIKYIETKFFHFLVTLIKNTQSAYKNVYDFVPIQDFDEVWTDDKLFKKYKLSKEEISFIETMIHPTTLNQNIEDGD